MRILTAMPAELKIEIYTTPVCPYCSAAKDLLGQKGVTFTEINVMGDAEKRREMVARASGRMTVPQIFIGATHVGGCDDLYELEQDGKLDPLLAELSAA
jgi:glutaredoxin 3